MITANLQFVLAFICLISLFSMCSCSSQHDTTRASESTDITIWKNSYLHARTSDERRAICMDAIDAAIIDTGCDISTLDQIFGSNLASEVPLVKIGELRWRLIYFDQLMPQANSSRQEQMDSSENISKQLPENSYGDQWIPAGWYIAVAFDSKGQVMKYHLSNQHK